MKRKNSLLILSLLFFITSFAQKKVFIDEYMKEIDSVRFQRKCRAHILKCVTYKTNYFDINKILFSYHFGEITKTETHQLKAYLENISGIKENPKSFIIISYKDTLYDFNEIKEKNIEYHVYRKNKNTKLNRKSAREFYLSNLKIWEEKQKKCLKKIKKKNNVDVHYIYRYAYKNATKEYKSIKWSKDKGIIKNQFFKVLFRSHTVIINPNGEYLSVGGYLDKKMLHKILKDTDWSEFKRDWQNSYQSLHLFGYGLFKKKYSYRDRNAHQKNCFTF